MAAVGYCLLQRVKYCRSMTCIKTEEPRLLSNLGLDWMPVMKLHYPKSELSIDLTRSLFDVSALNCQNRRLCLLDLPPKPFSSGDEPRCFNVNLCVMHMQVTRKCEKISWTLDWRCGAKILLSHGLSLAH